jgi:MFS family permease
MAKEIPLTPGQINEHNQVTDDKILRKNRFLMGLGYILNNSEENALGAIPTKIITVLGGDDRHLGVYGTVAGIGAMTQFLGSYVLRWKKSNRRAMLWIMRLAILFASLLAVNLFMGGFGWYRPASLPLYLGLMFLFFGTIGVQLNIESGWIGDLVPRERRGWFNSFKWMMSVAGMFVFVFIMAQIVQRHPTPKGFSAIYVMFTVSFVLACLLIYPRVTDRTPKFANYFSAGKTGHERLNYRSLVFWCYVGYLVCWSGGRGMYFAFTNVFMLQTLGLKITSVAWLQMVNYAASILALYIFGKVIDRIGSRWPLIFITIISAANMLLFSAATYWGVKAIVVSQVIAGLAGYTHAMLIINYALELFPDKGRAGYIGLSRVCSGLTGILSPLLGGGIAYLLVNFRMELWGRDLCRYHAVFLVSTAIVLCGMIPIILAGKKTVQEA